MRRSFEMLFVALLVVMLERCQVGQTINLMLFLMGAAFTVAVAYDPGVYDRLFPNGEE